MMLVFCNKFMIISILLQFYINIFVIYIAHLSIFMVFYFLWKKFYYKCRFIKINSPFLFDVEGNYMVLN